MKRFVLPLLAGVAVASVLLRTAVLLSFQVMRFGRLGVLRSGRRVFFFQEFRVLAQRLRSEGNQAV